MAGLLIKELKLRGLVERTLIICPANLSFQWRRELRDRFEEDFELVTGSRPRETYAVNVWNQHNQIITSMDLAKLDYALPSVLQQADWDLVNVDAKPTACPPGTPSTKASVTAWASSCGRRPPIFSC